MHSFPVLNSSNVLYVQTSLQISIIFLAALELLYQRSARFLNTGTNTLPKWPVEFSLKAGPRIPHPRLPPRCLGPAQATSSRGTSGVSDCPALRPEVWGANPKLLGVGSPEGNSPGAAPGPGVPGDEFPECPGGATGPIPMQSVGHCLGAETAGAAPRWGGGTGSSATSKRSAWGRHWKERGSGAHKGKPFKGGAPSPPVPEGAPLAESAPGRWGHPRCPTSGGASLRGPRLRPTLGSADPRRPRSQALWVRDASGERPKTIPTPT